MSRLSERAQLGRRLRIARRIALIGQTTGRAIARAEGISLRALYRDLSALRDLDAPIVGLSGYGYTATPADVDAWLMRLRRSSSATIRSIATEVLS